jgi:nucleotide-binding universal stress UspA family protein
VIRTILVPLDGSRFAEAALPLAVRLARAAHGRLRLVLAHETVPVLSPAGAPAWDADDDSGKREHAQTYLAQTAACLPADGKPIEYDLVDGEVGPALAERIRLSPPDLVVMATHGRGTIGRFWRGSVADYLVRHVSVPVLLVRPDRQSRLGIGTGFRKILVPLDLSETSDLILAPVKALARITQAHLTLAHVVEPVLDFTMPASMISPPDNGVMEIERRQAQQHLDRLAAQLRREGFSVATRVLVGAGVAGTLLGMLERSAFDLVALTTQGRSGLSRGVLGSVATRLVVEAGQPVLVLRPRPAEEERV